jgi:hypothetical protein
VTDNIMLVSEFRLTGAAFRASAQQLAASLELREDGAPARMTAVPVYFLACQAAELFLKCALLKRGFDPAHLREHRYRHDLATLLGELQGQGVPVTEETVAMVRGLADEHRSHSLRYNAVLPLGGNLHWPPLAAMFAALDELLGLTAVSRHGA